MPYRRKTPIQIVTHVNTYISLVRQNHDCSKQHKFFSPLINQVEGQTGKRQLIGKLSKNKAQLVKTGSKPMIINGTLHH